ASGRAARAGVYASGGIGLKKDERDAARLFEAAARAGDVYAIYNLSRMYAAGVGVERDEAKSEALLGEAVKSGLPTACGLFADRLSKQGNFEEARRYYQIAAEGGFTEAMPLLAKWYRDGIGGPPDKVQALRWLLKLIDFGDNSRWREIMSLARSMSDEEIREATRLVDRADEADFLIQKAKR